jgi:hypothetical protein
MSLDNLISVKLTIEQKNQILDHLIKIEEILDGKVINLTPKQRQFHGRIGDWTENWIKKVIMWMDQKPDLIPFYLNVENFCQDVESRENFKPLLAKIRLIKESLEDTSMLLSSDIYTAAIAYYRHIRNVSHANVPGTTEIYKDLATQFTGRSPKSSVQSKPDDDIL